LDDFSDTELPFKALGEFRLVRVIGRGATGTVYEAVQESLGRRVAVKVLSSSFNLDDKTVRRFLREASALARIRHRNIVPIFHVAQDHGVHFYAMELVDGQDVQTIVRERKFEPQEAARIARDVAIALESAHADGIIHRDIKPANLILEKSGEVKITDFGLAKIEQGGTITESGTLVGTPMYMSPEQALGSTKEVDRRSDVYSLGATLYEMLTGRPLFESENFQAILRMIVDVEPVPPRRLNPRIPRDLETIVLKSIHKRPERRYRTAGELADDIDRFLQGKPILARRATPWERGWRHLRRHKSVAVVGILIVALVGILLQSVRGSRSSTYELALRKGRIELYLKNLDTSLDQFERAVELQPKNPEAQMWRGKVLEEMGRFDDAGAAYEESVALGAGQVEPLLARAEYRLRRNDVAAAEQDFEKILGKLDPENSMAEAKLAKILFWYRSARDPAAEERALGLCRDVLEREDAAREARIEALRVTGMIYLNRQELDRARENLETAYQLDPVDPETQQAYFKVLDFQYGTEVDREKILTWMRLVNPFGEEPLEVGRSLVSPVEREIDTLKTTLQGATEGARDLVTGFLARRGRDPSPAPRSLDELNRILAKIPFQYECLLDRAAIFEERGEYELAARDYETAVQYHPEKAEPLFRLGRLYSEALDLKFRDLEKARQFAERAVVKDPQRTDCLNLVFQIHISSQNLDAARQFFADFFSQYPDHKDRARIERQLEQAEPAPIGPAR